MNVMLTCAGRRKYLVKFFQQALNGRGQVLAVDACADAPALQQADKSFVVPSLTDAAYIDTLVALCEQYRVRMLVPLNDLELLPIASRQFCFRRIGTIPIISSASVVNTCFDKWRTFQFLTASDLSAPDTYLSLADAREALASLQISFPLVVKPRWGTASVCIEYPEDEEELELTYALLLKRLPRSLLAQVSATDSEHCLLIQRRLCGQEYGMDVVNDLEGNYVCTFVRRKLAMRAGETDRAVTITNDPLEELGAKIGRKLGHIGVLDCDVIVTESGCYVIDMNPRFGGGYPFSHIAGANLPAVLLAWANQEQPNVSWLQVEPDIIASKCDELVRRCNKLFANNVALELYKSQKQMPTVLSA